MNVEKINEEALVIANRFDQENGVKSVLKNKFYIFTDKRLSGLNELQYVSLLSINARCAAVDILNLLGVYFKEKKLTGLDIVKRIRNLLYKRLKEELDRETV